jgi:hypothetical protein
VLRQCWAAEGPFDDAADRSLGCLRDFADHVLPRFK